MDDSEKAAWISFKEVVENFLDNVKSDNYKEIVKKIMNCIKLHFIHSHVHQFSENLGET